jgi:biotin-[acetyl-CoA-carboxylase] ligase BirA-like protein
MVKKTMPELVQERLCTTRFGKQIFFSRTVGSTNKWARQLAESGAEEGTVTVAETQTAGRGRLGREWISPHGGLWFSIVLRPRKSASEVAKLAFVASLAVARVLRRKYGLRAETKWPNDVTVNGRKICGILGETDFSGKTSDFTVLGIGINANVHTSMYFSPSIRPVVTSIQDELGRKIAVDKLLRAVLEELEKFYDLFIIRGFDPVLTQWKKYAGFLGKQIAVQDGTERIRGLAYDVDTEGALILKLENASLRRVVVGDVSLP